MDTPTQKQRPASARSTARKRKFERSMNQAAEGVIGLGMGIATTFERVNG